jgi:hypothetical protein
MLASTKPSAPALGCSLILPLEVSCGGGGAKGIGAAPDRPSGEWGKRLKILKIFMGARQAARKPRGRMFGGAGRPRTAGGQ